MPDATIKLRREPKQERSRRRVEELVAAAERVLVEEGAGALSTTRVAEAAGVSVGAVYQWFDDLDGLTDALALRYLEDFKALGRQLAEERSSGDPGGRALDAFADAFRARPGFRAMWFGGLRTERLRDLTRPGLADLTASLAQVLALEAPEADPARRDAAAAMVVRVVDAMLRQAFRTDDQGDPALLEETRTMLRAYLNATLGIPT